MSKKLTILIPAYNEYNNLKLMIPVLTSTLKKIKYQSEIVIIDDGSTDNTWNLIKKLSQQYANIVPVKNRTNRGLTETLRAGIEKSTGDIYFLLPGDYESHPNEDIPILLKKYEEGNDMVLGSRINRKGTKKISSVVYNWLIHILFKVKWHDSNWIKIFSKDIINTFKLRSSWHRYLPIFAYMEGYKVAEAKVKYYPRKYGKSKFGFKRLIIGLLDLIVIKFLLSFRKKPMLVFGSLGIITFILGFIGGIHLLYLHFVTSISNRPLIFLVMLLIILGIQFIGLGFLGELLVDLIEKEKYDKYSKEK